MPVASAQSFMGLSKEVTRGTPISPVTNFFPIRAPQLVDNIKYVERKAFQGSMTEIYDLIPTKAFSEYDFQGDVFDDTIGHLFLGNLGAVTTTGAGPIYNHVFALLNGAAPTSQPPAYTVVDFNGSVARQILDAQFSDITFKFNADGLLEYTAKCRGKKSTVVSAPTVAISTQTPDVAWANAVTINSVATTKLEIGELTFKRPVDPIWGQDGTQDPYRLWAGPHEVSGKMTLVYEDDTELTYFLSNTQPATRFLFSHQGSPASTIQIDMSNTAFRVGKITRGKTYVETELDFLSKPSTTNATAGAGNGYSTVKVTLGSPTATF